MKSVKDSILNCQVSQWNVSFQHLTYPRRLIPLTTAFVQFLVSDRVLVQGDTRIFGDHEEDSDSSEEGMDVWKEFPVIMQSIQNSVNELGSCVFPKLNWSAPTDVVWLSPEKCIKCTTPEEVLLFLRSSDRIAHDICTPFGEDTEGVQEVEFVLCLIKYFELQPQSEFRCFVRGNEVVGISQRDITSFYPQLVGENNEIREKCLRWFAEHIRGVFPLSQYSIDVYHTSQGKVKLIDFNAICSFSSPLLFSWEELGLSPTDTSPTSSTEADVEVRIVQDDGSLMLGSTQAVSMPYDMIGCSLTEVIETMKNQSSSTN